MLLSLQIKAKIQGLLLIEERVLINLCTVPRDHFNQVCGNKIQRCWGGHMAQGIRRVRRLQRDRVNFSHK